MPRYQFDARAHTYTPLRLADCKTLLVELGATRPAEAYPMMLREGTRAPNHRYWRGTNQPRTVAFTAPDDETAKAVYKRFDPEAWFVWNITEGHYV